MNEIIDYEEKEEFETKKEFFWKKSEVIETDEEVRERLEALGVEKLNLEGLDLRFQKEVAESLEAMYEEFPEINGYITKITAANMRGETLACTGPYMYENGYQGAEIRFNREFFSKRNYGLKIVDMDTDVNWRGERWLAGLGSQGIIDHEIAHVLQLKLNAESAGIEIGEKEAEKYRKLQELYDRNSTIVSICYDSLGEAGVSPKDIGRELSTYGATGFGEAFAEAISEVQTRKHPRAYATTIYNNYRNLISEKEEVA